MSQPESALGEGFFWMAEKLAWGYEGSDPNPEGAFRLFEQAADLGVSDALIRVGQFQEYGKGTARDLKAALQNYLKAAKSGNYCAHAFLAIMLSRGSQLEASSKQWNLFFIAFESNPDATFQVARASWGRIESPGIPKGSEA